MRYIQTLQLVSECLGYFAYIFFVSYDHQPVAQLKNHIRSRQQVYTGAVDTRDSGMILLPQIKRTDSLAVAFRPSNSNTARDQVVRFLALNMQVVILHLPQQPQ